MTEEMRCMNTWHDKPHPVPDYCPACGAREDGKVSMAGMAPSALFDKPPPIFHRSGYTLQAQLVLLDNAGAHFEDGRVIPPEQMHEWFLVKEVQSPEDQQ